MRVGRALSSAKVRLLTSRVVATAGYDAAVPIAPVPGLCDTCAWRRLVTTGRSAFVLCTRGLTDPDFPKYPALPVTSCRGYEPAGAAGRAGEDDH
jgi:hypothetical protein